VSNEFLANDESKTREQLIAELVHLRRQIAELESTNYAKLSVSEIFREFADHLPVVIWCIQPNLPQIEYVSAAYESVWGRTCASLYADFQTFIEAIHPSDRQQLLQALTDATAQELELEHRVLQPDRSLRWVHHQIFAQRNSSGDIISKIGIAQDITEQRYNQALQTAQHQVLTLMTNGAPLTEVLLVLTQLLESQDEDAICSILLCDPNQNKLGSVIAPSLPDSYKQALQDGVPIGIGMGSCGTAAYHKQPVIAVDIATDPNWVDYRDFARTYGLRACLSMPILTQLGELLGTFAIFYRRPHTPSRQDWAWIEFAAPLAGIAIARQQAETALDESETLLRLALDATQVGIWEWNIKTNQVNWSLGCEQVFGLVPGTFSGTFPAFVSCLHPEDQESVSQAMRQALVTRQDVLLEYRVIWPDDTLHWLEVRGNLFYDTAGQPIRMMGTAVEITARKQAEIVLQELNVQLEQQVQERTATLEQALHFDALLKRITDKVRDSLDESQILQTAVQELGRGLETDCDTALYNSEQTISTIAYEYVTLMPSAHGVVTPIGNFPELYSQLLRGRYVQFCRMTSDWPRPLAHAALVLACPIVDDQGAIGDIWLFKPPEEEFSELEIRLVQQVANQCAIAIRQARLYQTAQSQVQELQQLHTLKDDFLSTVSHELRTPVTNMRMAIQMLEISLKQPPSSRNTDKNDRYLKILRDECDREANLINDLLDLQRLISGPQPLCLETIDVFAWLPELLHSFEDRAQAHQQRLSLELTPNLPLLVSDRVVLTHILAELLNNACKYTPAHGGILLQVTAEPDQMQFQITNTGVEITASELAHIFDKFYRIPSADPWKQGGTGLGLALVQKRVEHLGGTITVTSSSGKTQFTVLVPNQRDA
jgi:PAS domain S-box-containing protein